MEQKRVPWAPLVLTMCIIVIDQIVKLIIIKTIPINHIGVSLLNDFLRIVHARNLGVAFSLGDGLPSGVRRILFVVLPIIVMVFVLVYYVKSRDLTTGMRWCLAGILGGGIGNLIDRIVRPLGVVDFVHIKVYGFLGMERWPVFNVADASVVVAGIALIVLFAVYEKRMGRTSPEASSEDGRCDDPAKEGSDE